MTAAVQRLRMLEQAFEPAQLVVEFRAGLRVAVRQVQAAYQYTVHGGFQIAALVIVLHARQASADFQRFAVTRQNGHTVPRRLPKIQATITRRFDLMARKLPIRRLQFLQAGDVGPLTLQPG